MSGLFEAISSLATMPERCPLIPEADEFATPIRQLPYGRRAGVYRIIFDVQSYPESRGLVRVLAIRHGARDTIRVDEIETAE